MQCFSGCSELQTVHFQCHSELRQIEAGAFADCSSLQRIFVSSVVDTIDGSAFLHSGIRQIIVADDNPLFKVCGAFLLNREGTVLVRYFGRDSTVEISRAIAVLSVQSFFGCRGIRSLHFERNSELRRIEAGAFSDCSSLQSIFIPSFVDTIDGSAFWQSGIREIIVADDNPNFKLCDRFLLDHAGTALIRYFASDSSVKICSQVEVIAAHSFSFCTDLTEVEFEFGSRLCRIWPRAFQFCRDLGIISLPSSTQELEHHCFAQCDRLRRNSPELKLTLSRAMTF
jgi:hypothetical protein